MAAAPVGTVIGVQLAIWCAFLIGAALGQLPFIALAALAALAIGAMATKKLLAVGDDDLPDPEGE